MIKFEYNGSLKVSLNKQILNFLDNSEFPIRFVAYDNSNKVCHYGDLHANTFVMCFDVSYKTVEIISSKGKKIATWKWDAMIHGDACQQAFNLWSQRNEGSQGICVGAHNGTSGEWVGPVSSGTLKAILVEPSDKQLNQLRSRYESLPWVNIENSLITKDGGEVVFYESTFQNGQVNSVNPDVISKCTSDYVEKRYKSISLRDLISKYNLSGKWWLHIDAEGIDDELIYSIDVKNLPSCLIFEYSHFDENRIENIKRWLNQNSYRYITSNMNMMCVRD